ncbi:MAG: hypothetical protein BVN33_17095 [Proteobacteria bacterium ST_bin13]|nr:MAG: hypothetical protein BVN33_17095 [Proteobacteria bacterium ST_bin13]
MRTAFSQPARSAWRLLPLIGCGLTAAFPAPVLAQSTAAPGEFALKVSGYANATGSDVGSQADTGIGALGETELEITPQYRTTSGTVFAARGVANVRGAASDPNSFYRLSVPELSVFAIGDFGRIELGERAGFPQSLVGFTPSEIAFTTPGFGPESGARLDPNGGLPTSFLPRGLGSRIDALTYLGYAARFYGDSSPKIIYLTPRTRSGFYGAVSYTPSTVRPAGFTVADDGRFHDGNVDGSLAPARFHDVVQAAFVWNHRTETLDVSVGATYSHANPVSSSAPYSSLKRSDSISGGLSATFRDTWSLGLSATYDGLSQVSDAPNHTRSATKPYGIVASADYVGGPWTVGGYYQHATADSQTLVPARDTVDIGEVGVSYLVDRNHDLLGQRFHTDVKLFASVYVYRFETSVIETDRSRQSGQVFLMGTRFSFY